MVRIVVVHIVAVRIVVGANRRVRIVVVRVVVVRIVGIPLVEPLVV